MKCRKSAYDSFKIKSLNHILPCEDILLKYYPLLYPKDGIPCQFNHKQILTNLLLEHISNNQLAKFIPDSISQLNLFAPVNDQTHDIYLILHQLVLQKLVDCIHSYTNKYAITQQVIFDLFTSLQQHLYRDLWFKHNTELHN